MTAKLTAGQVGEWIEVRSPSGSAAPRRGEILEVLGAEHHEHYRVRWTDEHESIFFPADGSYIRPEPPHDQTAPGNR